ASCPSLPGHKRAPVSRHTAPPPTPETSTATVRPAPIEPVTARGRAPLSSAVCSRAPGAMAPSTPVALAVRRLGLRQKARPHGRAPSRARASRARAHLQQERERHHRKGQMLPDGRRIHGCRERKIATEHGHHGGDFEPREGAPWTHPWPAPKRGQDLRGVTTPGCRGGSQPAVRLKLVRGGKRVLLQPPIPREEKESGAGWQ